MLDVIPYQSRFGIAKCYAAAKGAPLEECACEPFCGADPPKWTSYSLPRCDDCPILAPGRPERSRRAGQQKHAPGRNTWAAGETTAETPGEQERPAGNRPGVQKGGSASFPAGPGAGCPGLPSPGAVPGCGRSARRRRRLRGCALRHGSAPRGAVPACRPVPAPASRGTG